MRWAEHVTCLGNKRYWRVKIDNRLLLKYYTACRDMNEKQLLSFVT